MTMNLKSKWMAAASAIVVVGALGAGVAMASTGSSTTAPTALAASGSQQQAHKGWNFSPDQLKAKLDAQVKAGKLTQGQEDVMIQIATLRHDEMTKLQADEKAAIDAAVQSGKITQAQATQLEHQGAAGGHERGGKQGGKQGRGGGFFGKNMTADQVKAKLDAAVKAGKLTQAQADQMLQKWTAEQAAHANQGQSQSQAPSSSQGA